jgi:alkyl sulfatase BDS1-like metallo-beta-lactamase superfamily hydrolase
MRLQMGVLSRALRQRASKQFGDCLPPGEMTPTGLGPALYFDKDCVPPVLFPTHTFRGSAELDIGGLNFKLEEAPGETRDHLFIHLPDLKTILSGDNVYRAFPNLYAIRGSAPRPVRQWSESLDKIRWLKPEVLVPGHTEPIQGGVHITEILTAYRDAIAFLHASVVRLTNEGRTPDEMVELIRLPQHLASHPYLQQTYGKLPFGIRGIYEGYLGWFDGNPTKLQPLPGPDAASRWIELAGGPARLELAIGQALERGEAQWAAELCDLLLAARGADPRISQWKAAALNQLAANDTNPVARNYYRASAGELLGTCEPLRRPPLTIDTLRHVPIEFFMQALPLRLRYDRTADSTLTIGFEFCDTGKRFSFYIRRGIGEVRSGLLDNPEFVVTASEADFKALASGALTGTRAALRGSIKCSGGWQKLRFLRSILYPP